MKGKRKTSGARTRKLERRSEKEVSDFFRISELPVGVQCEVFSGLPIRDIMRCKCVCTSWYNLLSDPYFSEKYAANSPCTPLLLRNDPRIVNSTSPVLYLLEIYENGDCVRKPIKQKLPDWWTKKSSLHVVGSCNGVLCLSVREDGVEIVYVSNPFTGGAIRVPTRGREHGDQRIVIHNFGFTPFMNNFKVLRIVFRSWLDPKIEECEIITVGVDKQWRCLKNSFESMRFWSEVVCLNGAFNWTSQEKGPVLIFTFDLAEEKPGRIKCPPGLMMDSRTMDLVVCNNQLCLVDRSAYFQITVWTMREYSMAESWTKDVISRSWLPSSVHCDTLKVVAKLRNGDILLLHSAANSLISCNVEQKKCSTIRVYGVGRVAASSLVTCSPSSLLWEELIMKCRRFPAID